MAGNVESLLRVKSVVVVPTHSNQQSVKLPLEMLDNCTFVAKELLIVSLNPTLTFSIFTSPLFADELVTNRPIPPFPDPFWTILKLDIVNVHPAPSVIDNPPKSVHNNHVVPLPDPFIVIFWPADEVKVATVLNV